MTFAGRSHRSGEQARADAREASCPTLSRKAEGRLGEGWLVGLALLLGSVAGVASWYGAERLLPRLEPTYIMPAWVGGDRALEAREEHRQRLNSQIRKAASNYGILGAALGMALGLTGGLSRRSPSAAALAGLVGLVLGGAAGAGISHGVVPRYHRALRGSDAFTVAHDMSIPLLTHGGIWSTVGLAGGLALGLGLGVRKKTISATFGGMVGGVSGAVVFEFAGALLFPLAGTALPVAETPSARLLAHLSIALIVALASTWAVAFLTLRAPPQVKPA
jgi:hypothetical protein